MASSTDIIIQIPKNRKHIIGEPFTATVKYHLEEETIREKINLSPVVKSSGCWYEYVHNDRVQSQESRERNEDYKTYLLMNVKMVNKNPDDSVTSSNGSLKTGNTTKSEEADKDEGIKRYHVEILFKKPTGIFCLKNKYKTIIKVYPTVVSPFFEDPFLSAMDRTLAQLFSTKQHEIKLKVELEKGFITPSREVKVSFVVANNTDVFITLKTVRKRKT